MNKKSVKNLLKFAVGATSTFGALYCVGQDTLKLGHWIGLFVCLGGFAWFVWQMYSKE